jgi:hypothetical protein
MIPVDSQSQIRIGTDAMACSFTLRCVCDLCKNMVTQTFVMWPATITNRIGFHQTSAQLPGSGNKL